MRHTGGMRPRVALLMACSVGALAFGLGAAALVNGQPRQREAPGRAAEADNLVDASSSAELATLLAKHPGAVLLEFHASWCQPCQELLPRIEAFARTHPALLVVRVDASSGNAPLANQYGAETLPLLVRLLGGKEVDRRIGAPSASELERWMIAAGGP